MIILFITVIIVNIIIYCFVFSLQTNDSGLASYVASQIDRSLSWKVREISHIWFLDIWHEIQTN